MPKAHREQQLSHYFKLELFAGVVESEKNWCRKRLKRIFGKNKQLMALVAH